MLQKASNSAFGDLFEEDESSDPTSTPRLKKVTLQGSMMDVCATKIFVVNKTPFLSDVFWNLGFFFKACHLFVLPHMGGLLSIGSYNCLYQVCSFQIGWFQLLEGHKRYSGRGPENHGAMF